MEIPYSFLQRSTNNQFKDLAFFQILKRKGPYIERSLTKIENDLFYRHKLPGSQMKNIAFIKQIRLTLSAYQVLVNEIRNDFMMTELDSLGDSIHKMFSQMISIVNFFVAVVLKKQKLAVDELRQISVQEKKKKEMALKKAQDQYRARQLEQAQIQKGDRFKRIQQLKYNFKQLFKLQVDSEKQTQAMQKVWVSIVTETIQKAKQSMLIKDSELQKIIKDSCEYMNKNHSQLDHIVRLTKQDIIQTEKNIQTFGDQKQLLEKNEQRIIQMKLIARKLVNYVRDKVYDRTQVMVQTDLTQGDGSKGMMTTKELDEKRRVEVKMRAYERQLRQKDQQISEIQIKLKQAQFRLKQAQQSQSSSQYSQSQRISQKNSKKRSHQIKRRTFMNGRSSNRNYSSHNILAQKFSANLLRNNNNINGNKNRRAGRQVADVRSQQKQFNINNNENNSSFKVNPKVSVRGSNHTDMRKGSVIIMGNNRNSKKRNEPIDIVDKRGNNNKNINDFKSKVSSGMNRQIVKKTRTQSQHQLLLIRQKNNTNQQSRLSSSTLKDHSTIKSLSKQRQSVFSQDKRRNSIIFTVENNKPQQKERLGFKEESQSEQRQKYQNNKLLWDREKSQEMQFQQGQNFNLVNKKFYKVRNSHLILEAKSFQQMSRTFVRSHQILDDDQDKDKGGNLKKSRIQQHEQKAMIGKQQFKKQKYRLQNQNDKVSLKSQIIDQKEKKQLRNCNIKQQKFLLKRPQLNISKPIASIEPNLTKQSTKNNTKSIFKINQTIKLTIRPSFIKRYIQSTYNHPLTQKQKSLQTTNQTNKPLNYHLNKQQSKFFKKIDKINKSTSQIDLPTKSYFQMLDMGKNSQDKKVSKIQQRVRMLLTGDKKRKVNNSFSLDSKTKSNNILSKSPNKQNIHQNLLSSDTLTAYLKPVNLIKLKTQSNQSKEQQNFVKSCQLKKPIDFNLQKNKNSQKSNLRKSSVVRKNVSFVVVSMNGQRRKGLNVFQMQKMTND